MRVLSLFTFIIIAAGAVTPEKTAAQGPPPPPSGQCATGCTGCPVGHNWKWGRMNCSVCHKIVSPNCVWGSWCDWCDALVSEVDNGMGAALMSAELEELDALVSDHLGHLLVSPSRQLVVIQGGCTGKALRSIVFLPPEKIRRLDQLGLETLESFLLRDGAALPRAVASPAPAR